MVIKGTSNLNPHPMARNLFLLAALALLAGCTTPTEPPSTSGLEDLNAPAVVPAAPLAPEAPAATPAAVPAKGKLPLGPVRKK
jgi:uncharacterized lipoprotein YajG